MQSGKQTIASVVKRNGQTVPFSREKICSALKLAAEAAGYQDVESVVQLLEEVIADLEMRIPGGIPTVEQVEESIESLLFQHHFHGAARAYVAHRLRKERIREERDELTDIVRQILQETHRENANFGNSPAAKMLQIASTASRLYYTSQVVPREFMLAHEWGEIHIHDLDYYGKTLNCLQIDLGRLLRQGFHPGYGFVRPPRRLASAAALAATIIQCNQNDMYGGQSFPRFDADLGDLVRRQAPSTTPLEAFQAMESFVFTINTMHSRAGGNVPFSSVNVGSDTTEEGRMVCRALLEAYGKGLGRGESPLFPNIVFRVKRGISFEPEDPNYDLFQLAIRIASSRLNPTFSFLDAGFNRDRQEEVAYMGCRTRVVDNRCGPAVAAGRGNLAPVTLNLPGLALRTRSVKRFEEELDRMIDLAGRQLLHRFQVLSRLRVKDLPFLMGQGIHLGSTDLGPEDEIGPVIRHGTLAIGFIGLAECLTVLTGRHHGEDEDAWRLGLEIVGRLREGTNRWAQTEGLNFTAYATPAEGLSGRFTAIDRDNVGVIPGVTDRDYYTNSFHVPVWYPISAFRKIEREAPFHRLCNAGHISVVELPSSPEHNPQAVEKLMRHMAKHDAGYAGINFPLDECLRCGTRGTFAHPCPSCGSRDIRRIRRITGYLSTVDRFGRGKVAEHADRRPHEL